MPDLLDHNPEEPMTALAKQDAAPPAEIVRPADPMVAMIERIVLDPNADLAKLEKMLEMRERLEAQQARRAFDLAISEAKGEIGPIRKNHQVSFTNDKGKKTEYKHETLAEVERTVAPVLASHGLHYRYRVAQDMQNGGMIAVTCVLSHRDGHSEETTLQASRDDGPGRNNFQAVASAVTYLKRYSLMAILGLSSEADEEDDDGQAAGAVPLINADQFQAIRRAMEDAAVTDDSFCSFFHVEHVEELPAVTFETAMGMLRTRAAKKRETL